MSDEDDVYIEEFSEGDWVRWIGSDLAAPGPGEITYHPYTGKTWALWGKVQRVSTTDSQSVRVRWNNGRETIERARNLASPVAVA